MSVVAMAVPKMRLISKNKWCLKQLHDALISVMRGSVTVMETDLRLTHLAPLCFWLSFALL
eukprot:6336329-Ditylum_brightwellii.AAC.1